MATTENITSRELFDRACYTHPLREHHGIKAHQSDLARRHRAGDPHVIRYAGDEADGIPEHYKLAWTTEEKARLQSIYLTVRDWSNWTEAENEKESAAKLFVGILEDYGAALPQQVAIELPKQKERQRNLDSVANAFDKLVDSINRLDSAALAWLYATVEENAANVGMSVRPDGPDIVSLKRSWLRALAESGESRDLLNLFHSGVGLSIRKAAATLPKADRDDPRLGFAFALERLMFDHSINFTVTATGIAAEFFRSACELGGIDTESAIYWLKKADDTPDSERPFHAMLKSWKGRKTEG